MRMEWAFGGHRSFYYIQATNKIICSVPDKGIRLQGIGLVIVLGG